MANPPLAKMMHRFLSARPVWLFIVYIILDTLCIGLGMGVPIFCILFGFIVGWILVKRITLADTEVVLILRKILKYAIITASFTFLAMLLLWGPFSSYLVDPTKDLAQTGIPMILYEPRASLIGWIILMVLISPFLQLLTTIFSANLTVFLWLKHPAHA